MSLLSLVLKSLNDSNETRLSEKLKRDFHWHDDESLKDQTPLTRSIDSLKLLHEDASAIFNIILSGKSEQSEKEAVSRLPLNDPVSKILSGIGVSHYYNSMLHPPLSYRGNAFQYRSADGADNNILYPQLGKAGLPYARSVSGKTATHGARPDPGDLFDLLLARQEEGLEESKTGISSMLLYHAAIIIHDIFLSNAEDKNISDTSSYLDLSPLYGTNLDNQNTVRQHQRGLLKPDTFAEERLLLQPPGVCIYIIMYNRFHNHVAQQLLEINENGKFSLPVHENSKEWNAMSSEERKSALAKQDEDIFQTARLITTGLYVNISIHDYLRCLMGLHAYDTPWTLDPRIEIPGQDKEGLKRAVGNQVSVEFNLLYRFHSPLSKRDAEWTKNFFSGYLMSAGKGITQEQIDTGEIPVAVFKEIIEAQKGTNRSPEEKKKALEATLKAKTEAKYFPEGLDIIGSKKEGGKKYKFNRTSGGTFDDAELVGELLQAIEDPIVQFGAQNVPKMFKAIEILGILQARKWEVATLNEFREFFGFKRHRSFEDINSSPEIQNKLRDLYEDPDMVELYPGLFCEGQGRCLDPGTETPNGTSALWGGVFCDAVTLVRSDRFYTVDWNVQSLTSWGMHEVTSDPGSMKGSVMHRLFQRAFPGYFKYNSVHLWQPFYTPAMNLILAQDQGYLTSLDLTNLRLNGTKLNHHVNFKGLGYQNLTKKVTSELVASGNWKPKRAQKAIPPVSISSYDEIQKIVGTLHSSFHNVAFVEPRLLPNESIREMWTGASPAFIRAQKKLAVLVTPAKQDIFVRYFETLASEVLQREQKKFQKPIIQEKQVSDDIASLQDLMQKGSSEGVKQVFANEIKRLEGLKEAIQKGAVREQIYQIDIVKNFAIPLVTRFVSDFLGFAHIVRTVRHRDREYSESQIYQHVLNCQNYLSADSDDTIAWKRRQDFQKSINFLAERAASGAASSSGIRGFLNRLHPEDDESPAIMNLRAFGVECNDALVSELGSAEQAAAAKVIITLDTVSKAVMTFTETLAFFIDPYHKEQTDVFHWAKIQDLAFQNTKDADEQIVKYVLEAQRLGIETPVQCQYQPKDSEPMVINATSGEAHNIQQSAQTIQPGQTLLLHIKQAYESAPSFPNPSSFQLDRPRSSYLIYGSSANAPFSANQLTLLALTSMIKSIAKLKDLRVAHDRLGRLKRVMPVGSGRGKRTMYMTPCWDQLVAFPTTWNLRFNGVGRGIYTGPDNADQGHGMNQIYERPVDGDGSQGSSGGGTWQSGSGSGV